MHRESLEEKTFAYLNKLLDRLLAEFGGDFGQFVHEGPGGRGRLEVSIEEDRARLHLALVQAVVSVTILFQDSALELEPRKDALAAGIGQDFGVHLGIGFRGSRPADGTRRRRDVSAKGEL